MKHNPMKHNLALQLLKVLALVPTGCWLLDGMLVKKDFIFWNWKAITVKLSTTNLCKNNEGIHLSNDRGKKKKKEPTRENDYEIFYEGKEREKRLIKVGVIVDV